MHTTKAVGALLALLVGTAALFSYAKTEPTEQSARWATPWAGQPSSSSGFNGTLSAPVSTGIKQQVRARLGQWVWTRSDVERLREAHSYLAAHPQVDLLLHAGVWVGTIEANSGGARLKRANSPALAGNQPVAIVLRLDDSLHSLWDAHSDAAMAKMIAPLVAQVQSESRATGAKIDSLQLDYDCPTRQLKRWASLVTHLRGALFGDTELWLTSLPVHLETEAYWVLLLPVVDGHILQLFDTKLPCKAAQVRRLTQLLAQRSLPFALGVGAFERGRGTTATEHACWVERSASLRDLNGYRGHWVFPAARNYHHVLRSLSNSSTADRPQ